MFLTRDQRFVVVFYLTWVLLMPLAALAAAVSTGAWGAVLWAALLGWTGLVVLVWLRGRRRPHVL